jgi:DNA-binding NarL/FixJ family response regulator
VSKAIQVAVIDREGFFIDAVAHVLEQQPDIEVIATATIFEDFVESAKSAEIIVLQQETVDLTKELIELIGGKLPNAKLVVLGAVSDDEVLISYIERGAIGYVRKSEEFDRLLSVIRVVQRGEALAHPELVAPLFRRLAEIRRSWRELYPVDAGEVALTSRQCEVMELIVNGCSNAEIAEELSISIGTVKNHVHKIFGQLGVGSREQAATVFARLETSAKD